MDNDVRLRQLSETIRDLGNEWNDKAQDCFTIAETLDAMARQEQASLLKRHVSKMTEAAEHILRSAKK